MSIRRVILWTAALVVCFASLLIAQNQPRTTTEATINGKRVAISYGRPSINGPALGGHDLFAAAPVGTIWRLGRNEATVIETAGKLDVGGKELAPGKYSLWARRISDSQWVISFHPKTEDNGKPLWGAPGVKEGWVADMPLTSGKADDSSEFLDIKLTDAGKGKARMTIHFGNVLQTGTFGVK